MPVEHAAHAANPYNAECNELLPQALLIRKRACKGSLAASTALFPNHCSTCYAAHCMQGPGKEPNGKTGFLRRKVKQLAPKATHLESRSRDTECCEFL